MGKVLIIGAGGVGTVVAHKIAQNPDVFTEIVLASRTQSKCNAIANAIGGNHIVTDRVNADKVEDLVALFKKHKPGYRCQCGFALSGLDDYGCLFALRCQLSRYRQL